MIELADRVVLRRTWSQRFLIAFCALVTLGCFASAGAVVFVDAKFSKLQRISLSGVLAPASTSTDSVGVQNILLVGVDNEAGLASDNPIRNGRDGGTRSDTIMLLRVDPAKEQAALLSFPRDLWLPIGTSSRRDKINAALELGGPDLLIKTLAANFNIGVTHYVQVDFAQFEKLVDTIDGVAMPFDRPVRDEYTGLDIKESGCVTLDGAEALAYVRSRYFEYYEDGRWKSDPRADLSRIDRQQDFMKRALKRAVGRGLRNPVTLNRLVNVALASVTVDDTFSAGDIAKLASRFRSFNPETLQTINLPVIEDTLSDGASIVRVDQRGAKPYLDIFRGLDDDAAAVASVTVDVLAPRIRSADAARLVDGLNEAGFTAASETTSASPESRQDTIVRHAPEDRGAAEQLARYLDGRLSLQETSDIDIGTLALLPGVDLRGVRSEPLSLTEVHQTLSVTAGTGSITSVQPTTKIADPVRTSTTRLGIVPLKAALDWCA